MPIVSQFYGIIIRIYFNDTDKIRSFVMIPPRIKKVTVLENFCLEITYKNDEKKIYDMKKNLKFKYYKNLSNPAYFSLVKSVDTTIEWPNGEDVDPNDLYNNSIPIN